VYLCLYAAKGIDLRARCEAARTIDELAAIIRAGWTQRSDRGAEQRLELGDRPPLYRLHAEERSPLEMHTRGG